MEKSTQRQLFLMGYEVRDKVFNRMKRELMADTTDYRTIDRIYEILENKRLSKKERLMAERMAVTMAPQKTSGMDERVEQEYDLCWNEVMAKAIATGRIPPPSKEDVAFMKKMQQRMIKKP